MPNTTEREIHPAEIRELFINNDPIESWGKANQIVLRISPDIDLSRVRDVFDDVICLFNGFYPGYKRIQTPYHDLRHTLDVFMCTVRLLHGVHLSGTKLDDEEIAMIMVSALLHDVGYAQKNDEATGSGAQFTQTHVARGIAFMQQRIASWGLPPDWDASLTAIMSCTETHHDLSRINFPSSRTRLLGQIVGTADLVGQMADRCYLEKLLFLYLEFKEADLGYFQNIQDMLKKTRGFYDHILGVLDGEFGAVYRNLSYHFNASVNINRNFYLEAIERNINYLEQIVRLNESEWLSMLKRHGIVQTFQQITSNSTI
jgi:hypothetical protein